MTDRLYYSDAYMQEFAARVAGSWADGGQSVVVLDRTAFYPESGGQPCDTGTLGGYPVVEVRADDDRILHRITGPPVPAGSAVTGSVSWHRRFDHMQQHTGQHILSQAFLRATGAVTESFHMSGEVSTLDLGVGSVTWDQVSVAEDLANQVVFENRPVTIRFLDQAEVAALPLRKLPERAGLLRVVEVEGFDYSACGGTHCRATGEVGLIRVCRWERVRGLIRVEFVCGRRVLALVRRLGRVTEDLAGLFSTGMDQLTECIQGRLEAEKEVRRELGQMQDRMLRFEARTLLENLQLVEDIEVGSAVYPGYGPAQLNRLATLALESATRRAVLLAGAVERGYLLFGSAGVPGLSMGSLIKDAMSAWGGRGGGVADRGQGSVPDPADAAAVLDQALVLLRRACGRAHHSVQEAD